MPDTTITPLAPMTPDAAISAFHYLRAVQADDTVAATEFAAAEPRMPALLVDVAERIVVPITALLRTDVAVPCDDAFALEALGRVFTTTLRNWAQTGPDTAQGIAHAIIDFAAQILTDDHEDIADILRQLEAVGVDQALDAHPAPASGHPVPPVRITVV
ncbi:hypothetical protein I5Q34_26540 [Streptomyces sp. AV19]|uniref:hypothetical protein n=1 Tax=Streptomyces sp. AV19 TaxID=2793068 RepID=UPI0018FEBE22|nr:hypothetical protein [Streptomyces sp. AV19]MBH1937788.1 hypothetical protein [Streptomyces sp. AV19]MDG4537064.1 hypothetical protein [Streptomyces sp. AV19]